MLANFMDISFLTRRAEFFIYTFSAVSTFAEGPAVDEQDQVGWSAACRVDVFVSFAGEVRLEEDH